jgi:hypothetical protein
VSPETDCSVVTARPYGCATPGGYAPLDVSQNVERPGERSRRRSSFFEGSQCLARSHANGTQAALESAKGEIFLGLLSGLPGRPEVGIGQPIKRPDQGTNRDSHVAEIDMREVVAGPVIVGVQAEA